MLDLKSLISVSIEKALNALTPKLSVPLAASGWTLYYIHTRHIMLLPSTVVVSALVVAVLCSFHALTSLVVRLWLIAQGLWQYHRERKRITGELDYLTGKEREILSYLLEKKQKTFEVLPDGEEAKTLIAKGLVVLTARRPPAIHRDITVEVPTHVWKLLLSRHEMFPYTPPKTEKVPWRTPWMAR